METARIKVLTTQAGRYGFDAFQVDGKLMKVDTTDFSKINMEELISQITAWTEALRHCGNAVYQGNCR